METKPDSITATTELHNGVRMPLFGLGTYKTKDGDEVIRAVRAALDAGYRSIDTASFYDNERGVGDAIRKSGIPREDLFVATKLWNTEHGHDNACRAFDESRTRLGLDYIDLYMIHWPVQGMFVETWGAMEEICAKGHVRAIGVSNFTIRHMDELAGAGMAKPAVNQFELHPRLVQEDLIRYCAGRDIKVESWAPLMRGRLNDDPRILDIALKYGKTPPQVLLRWGLQRGFIVIPKSVNPARIVENSQVFDFFLSKDEMASINAMNRMERTGPDPDSFV